MNDYTCPTFLSAREAARQCLLWMIHHKRQSDDLSEDDRRHVCILYEVGELSPWLREVFGFKV